jgi:hypothetical protein
MRKLEMQKMTIKIEDSETRGETRQTIANQRPAYSIATQRSFGPQQQEELPSAYTWPTVDTVPKKVSIDLDLLGLARR